MKIHQVKGRHVNSYVIEDDAGLLVVDAAWHGEKYVLGYIHEELQRDLNDVKLVICTHGDPDHCGGIAKLASTCNANLAVPYAMPSTLLKFANDPTGIVFRLVTSLVEGMRPRAWAMYANPKKSAKAKTLPAYTAENEARCEPGNSLSESPLRLRHHTLLPGFEGWQVIHTPGHSWDSCCFYHRESGSLITGDTLLGSNKKGRSVKPSVFANPVQLARSVKLLRRLKPQAIYPGHGAYFSGSGVLDHH